MVTDVPARQIYQHFLTCADHLSILAGGHFRSQDFLAIWHQDEETGILLRRHPVAENLPMTVSTFLPATVQAECRYSHPALLRFFDSIRNRLRFVRVVGYQ